MPEVNCFDQTINQILGILFFVIFYIIGLYKANKAYTIKEVNKNCYYSIVWGFPCGFIITYFIISSISIFEYFISSLSFPLCTIVFWAIILFFGLILGYILSIYIIKKEVNM